MSEYVDGQNVFDYIKNKRARGPLHFTLIDPDKQTPEQAAELAIKAKRMGTDAIMVGGSQPSQVIYLDETVKQIKEKTNLPVILFPSTHAALSKQADAVFFMSLFNSRSPQYLIEEQLRGSVIINNYGLEPLSMAYLIIESGSLSSAAWGGDVKPIPRDKSAFVVGYALTAKYFGMKFIYLEAGSGAELSVPPEMVDAVKKSVGDDVLVIVGGGIRDDITANEKIQAGADIIVTGNIAEDNPVMFSKIIAAIKHKTF